MAAATARSTMREVASPIEVSTPSPMVASEAVAMTTVPPANTTAVPEEPMAWARARWLSTPLARLSRYRDTTNRA